MRRCFFFSLMLLLCACSHEAPSTDANSFQLSSSDGLTDLADVSKYFYPTIIKVKAPAANLIGGKVRDFYFDKDRLILIRRYPAVITCLNLKGEIEWQLKPTSGSPSFFTTIDVVKYDRKSKELIVYDQNDQAFFYYNENGEFIKRTPFVLRFHDYHTLNDSCAVYDVSQFRGEYETDDSKIKTIKFCGSTPDIMSSTTYCCYAPDHLPFSDYQNFIRVGQSVYFRSNFTDSVFLVRENGSLDFSYTVGFTGSISSQDIVKDVSIPDKYTYLYSNGIPFVDNVVRYNNFIYAVYTHQNENRMLILNERNNNQSVNSNKLICDNITLTTPRDYREGAYLSQMRDYEYEYLQHFKFGSRPTEADRNLLFTEEEQKADISGMVYVLLEFK